VLTAPTMRTIEADASGSHAATRARARVLLGAIALSFALLLVSADSGSGQAAAPLIVQIDQRHAARPVPRRFLGLSFELTSLGQVAGFAERGDFVNLLRSLGPGVLRFGGVSADTRVAWTDRTTPRPPWASSVLDIGQLRALRRLAVESGWRVLLTIGLVHFDPRAAGHEVAAAERTLGHWLAGVEVGNEPDAYAHHGMRQLPWTHAQYAEEVALYRKAMGKRAREIPLAGPGVTGSHAFVRWGPAEVRRERPALLTGHHYPLGCQNVPPPSIESLLSRPLQQAEDESLARFLLVSRRSGIPLRLDEVNTVSCGGVSGISDTFASALWATNYIAKAMAAGVSGINLHGHPASCRGYSPLCASSPARLESGELTAQPEWYALLLTRALLGDRPLRVGIPSVPAQVRPNITVTALRSRHRGLHLVIVDNEAAPAGALPISVQVGRAYRSATVLQLTGQSLAATGGVRLGGTRVSRDGSWRAPRRLAQIPVRSGLLDVSAAPSSAMLVTVTRGHRRARG
jgi:hypothetical protein